MLAIFACELASGGISRGPITATDGMPVWKATLIMLFSAPEEEILNRGALLSGVAIALGGRGKTAVLLSALAFGLGHLANPGASAVSAVGNMLGGLIYGYAFVMSGRLWLPIGLHFAWNLVQGPVLGFPVSGFAMGGFQQIHDMGPAWLTSRKNQDTELVVQATKTFRFSRKSPRDETVDDERLHGYLMMYPPGVV